MGGIGLVAGLVVVVVALVWWATRPPEGAVRHDGYYYRVAAPPRNLARLAALRFFAMRVVRGLPPSLRRERTLWRLRRCVFAERSLPEGAGAPPHLALTIDKGREIELCLDDTDEQALHYVLMHELAHVMSHSVGHTPEFYDNMDRLLRSARAQGLYTTPPRTTVQFCGSHVHMDR